MARQRRPDKSPVAEQPAPLHRVARIVSDWKIIITAVILFGGGIAFALSYKFATKDELEQAKAHIIAHDVEFAGFKQAISDIQETVHQIHDDQHQANFTHR